MENFKHPLFETNFFIRITNKVWGTNMDFNLNFLTALGIILVLLALFVLTIR